MKNQNNNPNENPRKNNKINGQVKKTYQAFFANSPKTMLMVSKETGIMRSNITRYVAELRKTEKICIVRYGICPISKFDRVQFLTTNPDLFTPQPAKL